MPEKESSSVRESVWLAHLSDWSGYEVSLAADWGRLLGLDPEQVIWRDLSVVADGLRLKFAIDSGLLWADLTGHPETKLRVALQWKLEERLTTWHGVIQSLSCGTQWIMPEPIQSPDHTITDQVWYDSLLPRIYHSDIALYVRNFYRLLACGELQKQLLSSPHLLAVAPSWRSQLLEPMVPAEPIDHAAIELDFLNYIVPKHPDFCSNVVEEMVSEERKHLF